MRQHYIPKFILEGFVDEDAPGNRGVWVYDAKHRTWAKRSTKRTATLDDFYSLSDEDGARDDELERLLHDVETPAALLLSKTIARRTPIAGAPHPEDLFITFCSLLIARNPSTVQNTKRSLVRDAQRWLEEITESPESFQAFRDEYRHDLGVEFPDVIDFRRLRTGFNISAAKAAGLGYSIALSHLIAPRLSAMNVDFLHAPPESGTFITADVPYFLLGMPDDLATFDQVVIPLSSGIAAIFDAAQEPSYNHVTASASVVRAVNRAILTTAQEFIVGRTPDAFDKYVLDAWATADPASREAIIRKLVANESGPKLV